MYLETQRWQIKNNQMLIVILMPVDNWSNFNFELIYLDKLFWSTSNQSKISYNINHQTY